MNNSAEYPHAFPKEADVDGLVDAMCHLGYEKDSGPGRRISCTAYLQVLEEVSTLA